MDTPTDEGEQFPFTFQHDLEPFCRLCRSYMGFHRYHCPLHPRWLMPPPDQRLFVIITGV